MKKKNSVTRKYLPKTLALIVGCQLLLSCSSDHNSEATQTADENTLLEGFQSPPNEARPRVWWHWMNGNVTKDGIAKDFDWMQQVGIGGVQTFDVSMNTPQIVEQRLVYMTPEWQDAFRFAATEADKRGLELTVASSPGWSETGGPWVKPEDGLKKLVWTKTRVTKNDANPTLAHPPETTGRYQKLPKASGFFPGHGSPREETYYQDVAVLALPVKPTVVSAPKYTASNTEGFDASILTDEDFSTSVTINRTAPDETSYVNATFDQPKTIQAATVFVPSAFMSFIGAFYSAELQFSDDGTQWTTLQPVAVSAVPTTVAFKPVTAAYFRLALYPNFSAFDKLKSPNEGVIGFWQPQMVPMLMTRPITLAEMSLSESPKIHRAQAKAGYLLAPDYYALSEGLDLPNAEGPATSSVLNLTDKLKADGTLNWQPPAGEWDIYRLGYSLLGTTNHPAPPEATGLEVDKYDGPAVRRYMEQYLQSYAEVLGEPIGEQSKIDAILTDSIEVGAANWTPKFVEQFKHLRGYDPTPWLPTITGVILEDREQTDQFLYDYRKTLADLMASEHYSTVAEVAHENGLKVYGEALEDKRPSLGDDMAMRRYADFPMAAMWTESRPPETFVADIKGAASVAHLYGQNIVAAESLTAFAAPWAFAPSDLKRVIDFAFALGVNRPVIHTSVHVPVDDKLPGLSLGGVGQFFNRNETWASMAGPWVDYLSRSAYMLQQGRYFADVAYFYGEEAPITGLFGEQAVTQAPTRYGYDFVNADVLQNVLSVDNGQLVASTGARYQALYLGGSSQFMTLALLERVAKLVEQGATVIGLPPKASPGLLDSDQSAYQALIDKLWSANIVTQYGKGQVYASDQLEAALIALNIQPDFEPESVGEFPFVHRRLADGDSYFVVNRTREAQQLTARFRVTGKQPELWHAETGKVTQVSFEQKGDYTHVPLAMAADDSVFVVFRKPTQKTAFTLTAPATTTVGNVESPWTVNFQPNRGAPESSQFDSLIAWNKHDNPGIKYFSGIASYHNTLDLPDDWQSGQPLWLDLGEVRDLAEVLVNGESVGITWRAPHRLDISQAVKAGTNTLTIKVANLWVNRLIGDQQEGVEPITFTDAKTYYANAPLRTSGLLGPVKLLSEAH